MTSPMLARLRTRLARIDLRRSARRIDFYTRNGVEDVLVRRKRIDLARALELRGKDDRRDILERVAYYNRLDPETPAPPGMRVGDLKAADGASYYYYDFKAVSRYFDAALTVSPLFGDINYVPDAPAIVKSRPVGNHNANAVVLKLDALRHFFIEHPDRIAFAAKLPVAAWRGSQPENPKRKVLVDRWGGHPHFDVAFADYRNDRGNFLTIPALLRFRYLISVEGNDVATNLKWILASNSLCLTPRPSMETWFMEGRLKPGVHYAEVRTDYADLEDKIAHFEANPDEARAIIANANAWTRQFHDARRERLIGILVLRKYFEMTGQLPRQFF